MRQVDGVRPAGLGQAEGALGVDEFIVRLGFYYLKFLEEVHHEGLQVNSMVIVWSPRPLTQPPPVSGGTPVPRLAVSPVRLVAAGHRDLPGGAARLPSALAAGGLYGAHSG